MVVEVNLVGLPLFFFCNIEDLASRFTFFFWLLFVGSCSILLMLILSFTKICFYQSVTCLRFFLSLSAFSCLYDGVEPYMVYQVVHFGIALIEYTKMFMQLQLLH
uniref:Uncharacterized protein n=1 Tax=Rhizophora mucronata TaxID=61149 RepID=A0A2P2JTQ0_RHIMU